MTLSKILRDLQVWKPWCWSIT